MAFLGAAILRDNPELKTQLTTMLFSPILILIIRAQHLYKLHVITFRARHLVLYTKSIMITLFVIVVIQFILRIHSVFDSRLFYVFFVEILLFMGLLRVVLAYHWIFNPDWNQIFRSRTVVYGAGEYGKVTTESILQNSDKLRNIIGFIDDEGTIGKLVYNELKNLGNLKTIDQWINTYRIDEVIIAINNITHDRLTEIIKVFSEYPIKTSIASEKYQIISRKLHVDTIENTPIYGIASLSENPFFKLIKRMVDILGSLSGIIILWPVYLFAIIGVKLSSAGPIIFKQERIGLNGEPFMFFKFRSMVTGSDQDATRQHRMEEFIAGCNGDEQNGTKIVNESKITRFGRFIRKYSIDELPQLFNVLKGDMSLVGPRPMIPYEWNLLEPWHRRRASVKPGCSGLWQVSGRSSTAFDDMIILDLYYVDNVSPWFDLEILLKTIPTLLFGHGGK